MDVVIVESTHANKVLEGLNSLWLKKELCDVTLWCGGQEFPCHRVVLASFSSYFEGMFTSGMLESKQERITINDVEPEALSILVSYAYTSKVSISNANVQALLAVSNLFDVTAVIEACCRYMEFHMDELNCVEIHCLADALSCATLEQHSMDYILEHFSDVYQQDDFLSLSVDKLSEIVSSDHLNVPEEEMVFEAAMLWLNKCPTHRESLDKVLAHVRLPLVSPLYLRDVIECVELVKDSQGCQRLISEAKRQHLLPYSQRAQPRHGTTVILIVGGRDGDSVESFDPLTNDWKTLARLPITVSEPSLVVSGSYVYLAGGLMSEHDVSKEMWRYDPFHDSWVKMASMNDTRSPFNLVTLGGYLFAVQGQGRIDTEVNKMERYNPITNTWQLVKHVGMRNDNHPSSAVVLDGLIYAMDYCKTFKYNPETSVWTKVAPVQFKRFEAGVCTLNGKVYLIGGEGDGAMNQVESFDPKTNQWTMCAPMNKKRYRPGVAVVHGKIYVLGGYNPRDRDAHGHTIEQYDDERDTWETVGQMPTSRKYLRCVSLRLRKNAQLQMNSDDPSRQMGTAKPLQHQ